jgi:single-stranded-DNA-specific exonuclease
MQSFKGYRWRYLFLERKPSEGQIKKYGYLLAQLLVNRGWETLPYEGLKAFPSPKNLPNIEEASEKIIHAVKKKIPILVFGDYDVDGITSTVAFTKLLRKLGAKKVLPIVPSRESGYGINPKVVENFSKYCNGRGLVVTLDNGTKEVETIDFAKRKGLDVVIFDHHTPGEILPDAILVNPKIEENVPFGLKDLSTVGLVFMFALHLKREGFENIDPSEYLDLAALGTVADVSPLSFTNFLLVRFGLERLRSLKISHKGLKLLLQNLRVKPELLNEHDIAFKIAPRLNAFGRMSKATKGLQLLMTEDESRALNLLHQMEEINELRKRITRAATEKVLQFYERNPSKALIYKFDKLGKGIVGIVAGRVTSSLGIPSIIFSADGSKAVGSARSPEGINIVEILEKLSNLLERWGGHSQAAGLTVKEENLEQFKELFENEIEHYKVEKPILEIDFKLEPKYLNEPVLKKLKKLAPYGAGNRPPTFVFEDVLERISETPYGYRLSFRNQKRDFYLNVNSKKEKIPPYWVGRKLEIAYQINNPDRGEISIEDLRPA